VRGKTEKFLNISLNEAEFWLGLRFLRYLCCWNYDDDDEDDEDGDDSGVDKVLVNADKYKVRVEVKFVPVCFVKV
jgi:hypothetical protein